MSEGLRIAVFEPWRRGSHERFLEAWVERSSHGIEVHSLPGRDWKWRMAAGAAKLAEWMRIGSIPRPDVLFATDYVDLPQLLGLLPTDWAGVPTVLYFHENQLTYPQRPGEEVAERDLSYGFTNTVSCIAADLVVFNSAFHRDEFTAATKELYSRLPKPRLDLGDALENARVVPPGIEFDAIPLGPGGEPGSPLVVLFNHRREHDKDPVAFLRALVAARTAGAELELVMLGEDFEESDREIDALLMQLGSAVRHELYVPDRGEYARLLGASDLVVSTSRHEFFGISVLEALAAGCTPLVPDRLAYPEVIPDWLHAEALHSDGDDLVRRLIAAAERPATLREADRRRRIRDSIAALDVRQTARALDTICTELAGSVR